MARRPADPELLQRPDGLKYWPPARQAAWWGLLEAHRRVVRTLDRDLGSIRGLGYRAYELLARLAHCGAGRLRMSALAEQTLLSQSRVSRMVDDLQRDGFVEREPCQDDSRVVFVSITERGLEILREAQDTFFASVEEQLFGGLSERDVEELGRILGRIAPGGADGDGAR
jgi:DNA-binding MarR family transcriptional regulator